MVQILIHIVDPLYQIDSELNWLDKAVLNKFFNPNQF